MRIASAAQALGLDLSVAPRVLRRVLGYTLHHKGRLAFATATSLAATFFNLASPRLLGLAVDQAHALLGRAGLGSEQALPLLGRTALLLLGAAALRGLLQMLSGYNSEYLGQVVARDLRVEFFSRLQTLDFQYHDQIHSGDLITRGMLDIEGVRGVIEMGLQRFISLSFLLIIGFAIIVRQDPVMALATFSFVPFVAWRAVRMGLNLRLAWTQLQKKMAVLTRVMEENLQGARVVRAFASQDHEQAKFDLAGDEALALSNRRIIIRARSMAGINLGYYVAMALVLCIGSLRITSGHITIGQLTECLAFMTILQLPVRQISMIANSSARAISSGQRLFEVLDRKPSVRERPDAAPLTAPDGELRFDNVSFAYDGGPQVLNKISFRVARGRTLGIIGPSGAGKSTIAHLIPRFYDVTEGCITLGGQDIRDVSMASLREAVALVRQDVFLFDDTARRNIAYAAPDAEAASVEGAAEVAHIHEHFSSLPRAYDTPVGERGANLSGGQRQRVSIATGLVPEPAILVFDDATSAVDAATEAGLRAALQAANRHRATIIISHRLSSVMHADEIIVLDHGVIVERGDHRSLLAKGGFYARLYALQTQGAAETVADVPLKVGL